MRRSQSHSIFLNHIFAYFCYFWDFEQSGSLRNFRIVFYLMNWSTKLKFKRLMQRAVALKRKRCLRNSIQLHFVLISQLRVEYLQRPEFSPSVASGKSNAMFEKFVKCQIRNSKRGLDGSIFVFGTFSPT